MEILQLRPIKVSLSTRTAARSYARRCCFWTSISPFRVPARYLHRLPSHTERSVKSSIELSNGQWNIPTLLTLLNQLPQIDGEFDDFEMEQDSQAVGRRPLLVSGRRLGALDVVRKLELCGIIFDHKDIHCASPCLPLPVRARNPATCVGSARVAMGLVT
jgi:hypothetical protein